MQKLGLKPLLGLEADWVYDMAATRELSYPRNRSHVCLIAEDNVGLSNVWALASLANTKKYKYKKPLVTLDLMREYRQGIWASDGCMITELGRAVEAGDEQLARQHFAAMLDVFGDRFYCELHTWQFMDPNTDAKRRLNGLMTDINQAKLRFANEMGVPLVVVNDAHHCWPHEWENKELAMKFGKRKKGESDDAANEDDEYGQKADHLMADDELYYWMARHGVGRDAVSQAIANAEAIAELCHAEIGKTLDMPRLTESEEDDLKLLVRDVEEGFRQKVVADGLPEDVYRARLEEEMSLIGAKRFAGYFNLEKDLVDASVSGRWAPFVNGRNKERPMLLGPARGSAGGCLVAWLLGITALDPIHYDLMFERFLDPDRDDNPDIDVDFPQSMRPDAKAYLEHRYGHDHVCTIQILNRSKPKQILRDVARTLQVPLADVNKMSKIIEQVQSIDAEVAGEGEEASWDEVLEKKGGELADWGRQYPLLFQKINEFLPEVDGKRVGQVRQSGRHPSGVLVANKRLLGNMPTRTRHDDPGAITQFDMYEVEKMGAVKMDLLGLRHLDTLMHARNLILERHGVWLDYRRDHLPERLWGALKGEPPPGATVKEFGYDDYSDPAIWPQVAAGHTLGFFQLETPELTRTCQALKPQNEVDVAAAISIIRPGVKDAGLDKVYLSRRNGHEPVEYDHPLTEPITGETFGVLIYQEQLMKAAKSLAGFTPGEANALRRALSKKNMDKVLSYKEKFLQGCRDNPEFAEICWKGSKFDPLRGEQAAEKVWRSIEASGRYAFNKCWSGNCLVKLGGSGSNGGGTMKIEDMWRRLNDNSRLEGRPCWYGCLRTGYRGQCQTCRVWRQKFRSSDPKRGLRGWSLGDDGRLHPNRIVDVHQNGIRSVWRVTLANGSEATTTANHRHMTPHGWREVWELSVGDELLVCGAYEGQAWEPEKIRTTVGDRQRKNVAVGDAYEYFIDGGYSDLRIWTETQQWVYSELGCGRSRKDGYRIERAHLDGDRTNNDPSNLAMKCASHHKKYDYQVNDRRVRGEKGYPVIAVSIISIEYAGEEMTYDLEMADPYHSWVGNGIVTHNSHAVGYAIIPTWEVWTKHYYPIEFMCALKMSDPDGINRYVRESRRLGFKVLPPDINLSGPLFTLGPVGSGEIRYGLGAVRGLGAAATSQIDAGRPYKDLADYCARAGKKGADATAAWNLVRIGAFDSMGSRLEMTEQLERERAKKGLAQSTLDDPVKLEARLEARLANPSGEWRLPRPDFDDPAVIYEIEQELCGNHILVDPMEPYEKVIAENCIPDPAAIEDFERKAEFAIGGQLTAVKPIKIKKEGRNLGKEMAFAVVEWMEQDFDVTIFPDMYTQIRDLLTVGAPVVFWVQRDDRGCHLKAMERLDLLRQS